LLSFDNPTWIIPAPDADCEYSLNFTYDHKCVIPTVAGHKRVYANDINLVHNVLVKYNKQNITMFLLKTERSAFSAETLCKKLILECSRTRGSTLEYVINETLNRAVGAPEAFQENSDD